MSKTSEQKAAEKAAKEAEKAQKKAEADAKKAAEKAAKEAAAAAGDNGIEVGDPQALRPVELPLVVKPTSGEWANEAQAQFAAILNAYAYRNQAKWAKKKDKLIAQLADLAEHPENFDRLKGGEDGMKYSDKRVQQ